MKLSIYSLKKILFDGEIESVNCQTENGEITVLDHHRPLVSMLKRGVIKITDEQEQKHYINAGAGFIEVRSDNQTRFIVDEEK